MHHMPGRACENGRSSHVTSCHVTWRVDTSPGMSVHAAAVHGQPRGLSIAIGMAMDRGLAVHVNQPSGCLPGVRWPHRAVLKALESPQRPSTEIHAEALHGGLHGVPCRVPWSMRGVAWARYYFPSGVPLGGVLTYRLLYVSMQVSCMGARMGIMKTMTWHVFRASIGPGGRVQAPPGG